MHLAAMKELLALSGDAQDAIDPWHAEATLDFIAQVIAMLGHGAHRVLDVGCGTGIAGEMFVALGCDYTGVTASSADLLELRKRGLGGMRAEMSELPFPDGAFDLIWCRHALEHALALPLTLVEMRRLAPIVAAVVPSPPNWLLQPGHFYTMEKTAWVHLFVQTGWRAEAVPCRESREYRWLLRREKG